LAGWVLDARQAKRLFPLCASAAILGGFVGMISAGPLAKVAGTENLILAQAALLSAGAALTWDVSRAGRTGSTRRPTRSVIAELRLGFDYVRASPLMRLIAAAYILFAILFFSVSYPFLTQMTAAFPAEADLATALGLLSAATTAVSFFVAVFLANRLFARFGIATVALILPVVYLAGFGIWLVRFSFATAVGFRFAQQVTQRGVSNAAWSAFYNVVPGDRRAQVLAFMDGVPGQIGIALAGLLLLAAGDLLSQTATFVLGAVAAVAVAWIVVRIRRAYADSLLRTLRDGLGEQLLEGGPGLVAFDHDPKVVAALRAGLTEPNPGVRRLSADLLGRLGAPESAPDLLARLDDDDPGVRATAVRALCALGSPIPVGDVDRLAADDDPVVRAAVAEVFVQTGSPDRARSALDALINGSAPVGRVAGLDALARIRTRAPDADLTTDAGVAGWVSDRLQDPSADVRAAAVGALSTGDPAAPDPIPELIRALDDDDAGVRLAAARALEGRADDARGPTLEVLQTGSERAQDAALDALDGHGDAVRPQLVAWALAQIDGAATLRRQTRALGGPPTDPDDEAVQTVAFLQSVLTGRRTRIEERLVHALAILGAPDDAAMIRRCLRSGDAETRAMALEALDSLGDRHLSQAVVALLEDEPDGRDSDRVGTLRALLDDSDPWTRMLAGRVLERTTGGGAMPATTDTLDEIARMLVLRRVPLFSGLAPEDLQRIAAGATEQLYSAGEALVREGETDDALVVIVEGSVRVVHADGEYVRSYAAGDHIGELAVLRDRPRAATVIADVDVRGLSIGGAGLKAILRERPEAAMAMLATLAER
ncbi:MAG TPA: HEAT repeat domain-containing protein, partial [Patescibacteria group bacterium]|nr:HEAT repeat domain-containing protein [Patescibacteria group bacterium]